MRSVQSMIWETSLLDAQEGIRFRGHSIPDLQKSLPKAKGGHEPVSTRCSPSRSLARSLTPFVPSCPRVSSTCC
jgi:hypothetical protein